MSEMEKRFGRYAVRDLSLKLIILYLIGYAIYYLNANVMQYLTLDPYAIVHGQVWRIVSWLLIPPHTSNLFFVAIMLFFYYSIGTSLERVWGVWQYNVFIFTGILLTVAAAFIWMGFTYLTGSSGILTQIGPANYFAYYSLAFSTYYINMGIFLAYALTFPDAVVLMFFIIPMKVKWLGLLDVAYLIFEFIETSASRMIRRNTLSGIFGSPGGQNARRMAGRTRTSADAFTPGRGGRSGVIHRCAICGRTQNDNPDLEFRYCSKCEGSLEYCQDHLFTHVHVKAGEKPHVNITN